MAEILTEGGRVSGVTLEGGDRIAAPVVVSASGPHSYKVNGLAEGVLDGMTIGTRALREEVCHVSAPQGIDYARTGMHFSDPIRFPLKHTTLTADLGFYSRKREINEQTSFSVLG